MRKKITFIIFLLIVLLGMSALPCLALNIQNSGQYINTSAGEAGLETGIGWTEIVVRIIQAILGLVGVVFFILVIYGGYVWMTARGNEENVNKAKKIIISAIIGLAIIVTAYSISYFVASLLEPQETTEPSIEVQI
ncbi:hypothetical protein JW977_03520 [Candidatus Falkowbacteria bacterium]|nr:hypothetical protein [Candidatus Falkowbacteria bacterium]